MSTLSASRQRLLQAGAIAPAVGSRDSLVRFENDNPTEIINPAALDYSGPFQPPRVSSNLKNVNTSAFDSDNLAMFCVLNPDACIRTEYGTYVPKSGETEILPPGEVEKRATMRTVLFFGALAIVAKYAGVF